VRRARRLRRPRLRRASLFVIALIALVYLMAGLPYAIGGKNARLPTYELRPVALALPDGVTLGQLEDARVDEVVDGDTIAVTLADGKRVVVRYFGVDTPERGDRCFWEATERNRRLVGEKVRLLADARTTDAFERSLRYVFTPEGVSIDATLVGEGLGWAWRKDGRYRDGIIALEDEARVGHRGCLWPAASTPEG